MQIFSSSCDNEGPSYGWWQMAELWILLQSAHLTYSSGWWGAAVPTNAFPLLIKLGHLVQDSLAEQSAVNYLLQLCILTQQSWWTEVWGFYAVLLQLASEGGPFKHLCVWPKNEASLPWNIPEDVIIRMWCGWGKQDSVFSSNLGKPDLTSWQKGPFSTELCLWPWCHCRLALFMNSRC